MVIQPTSEREPSVADIELAIDRAAQLRIDDGTAVGLSVAVVQNGELALLKQYGLATIAGAEPMTADSVFPIGSVSKQFTAAAVLLLIEDGKLSLETLVSDYFPDLTRAENVTVRDLLNNVSGYVDWYPLNYIDARKTRRTTPEAVRKEFGWMPLDFEPGSFYSYSNTGFLIAARIAEEAAGESFVDFLDRRIFRPLQMRQTGDYRLEGSDIVGRYTAFFGGPIEEAIPENLGWLLGAGGLMSTPRDLAKWSVALMKGTILSPGSWVEMIRPRDMGDGRVSPYSLGQLVGYRAGHRVMQHRGAVSGAVAEHAMLPDDCSSIVWCSNSETALFGHLTTAMFDCLVTEERRRPQPDSPPAGGRKIVVEGPPPEDVARALFDGIVNGSLDRSQMIPECKEFLCEDRMLMCRDRMADLGSPASVTRTDLGERGGADVVELVFAFASGVRRFRLCRFPDGRIAEFGMV